MEKILDLLEMVRKLPEEPKKKRGQDAGLKQAEDRNDG